MAVDVRLPDIGEGMQEGEIVRLLVREGERVVEDQGIVEVLTDKVVAEIPAPATGVVERVFVDAGTVVEVNGLLLRIAVEGDHSRDDSRKNSRTSPDPHRELPLIASDSTVHHVHSPTKRQQLVLAAPATRRLARELGVRLETVKGTGPGGRVLEEDVRRDSLRPDYSQISPERQNLDVLDRRDIDDNHGGDDRCDRMDNRDRHDSHDNIANHGGDNRDSRDLYDTHYVSGADPTNPNPSTDVSVATQSTKLDFNGLRGTIAKNMVKSAFTIPHVTHFEELDVTELIHLREQLKPKAEARGVKLTFLPFFLKALALALREYPVFNATWSAEGTDVYLHPHYHLGIAVDTAEGLVVPVIKDVDKKSLLTLAEEVQQLAEKARAQRLTRDDISGGTFTVSSVGARGGTSATPIIRHPEVALIAFHKIKARPVVVEAQDERTIVIRDMMNVSLSFDHRVTDGVRAVNFTNRLGELLADPQDLLLLM
ncbi:dihydrolipoamide acetyltransferase family protein [Numidum massiliense]|uniref:dihydrolipoamide acetyltransferase family protein n=1 Tax=Numidum massiliense TaxID=1522315 RepID=UPI0006D5AC01|nr:dihydrolipoamide acetyltransferase family protein [Numidum massiliense]